MPSIFDPSLSFREQRGSGPISPDPFGTGRECQQALDLRGRRKKLELLDYTWPQLSPWDLGKNSILINAMCIYSLVSLKRF